MDEHVAFLCQKWNGSLHCYLLRKREGTVAEAEENNDVAVSKWSLISQCEWAGDIADGGLFKYTICL